MGGSCCAPGATLRGLKVATGAVVGARGANEREETRGGGRRELKNRSYKKNRIRLNLEKPSKKICICECKSVVMHEWLGAQLPAKDTWRGYGDRFKKKVMACLLHSWGVDKSVSPVNYHRSCIDV